MLRLDAWRQEISIFGVSGFFSINILQLLTFTCLKTISSRYGKLLLKNSEQTAKSYQCKAMLHTLVIHLLTFNYVQKPIFCSGMNEFGCICNFPHKWSAWEGEGRGEGERG